MSAPEPATLLRIHVGELDKAGGQPLHEAIVAAAREAKLAGATVLRGVESFGARLELHTAKVLRLSENLPLVIEIVDTAERVRAFLSTVEALMERAGCGGLATLEKVEAIQFRGKSSS